LGILFYFLLTVSLFSFMGGHWRAGFLASLSSLAIGIWFAKTAVSRLREGIVSAAGVSKSSTLESKTSA